MKRKALLKVLYPPEGLANLPFCQESTVHLMLLGHFMGFPDDATSEEAACQCRRCKRPRFDSWVGKISWRREWQSTSVFLLRESHGQRSLGATVHGIPKSQTQLKQLSIHSHRQFYKYIVLMLSQFNRLDNSVLF